MFRHLHNTEFHYRVQDSRALYAIQSQFKPLHTLTPYFRFNTSFPSASRFILQAFRIKFVRLSYVPHAPPISFSILT
jgi:hypothetical protein